ncbi:hypothetical protein SH528x_002984 [Novipirellula sp. SH528]|uniref:hypothetical protein n=1 Tax=Novipirellula sp. SH528 TaxID=3454466 RepID=UPI003FA06609
MSETEVLLRVNLPTRESARISDAREVAFFAYHANATADKAKAMSAVRIES